MKIQMTIMAAASALCLLSGCDNELPLDNTNELTTRAVNATYCGFEDIFTSGNGSSMSGTITCDQPTEYTFTLNVNGSGSYNYSLNVPGRLIRGNGNTMQTVTLLLPAGTSNFSLAVVKAFDTLYSPFFILSIVPSISIT